MTHQVFLSYASKGVGDAACATVAGPLWPAGIGDMSAVLVFAAAAVHA